MDFKLTKPCHNCPFRRVGGIRLHKARASEIANGQIRAQGGDFPCHKTVNYETADENGDVLPTQGEQYCAGAIAFALNCGMLNQSLRVAQRLRLFRADQIQGRDEVFLSRSEMLAAQSHD